MLVRILAQLLRIPERVLRKAGVTGPNSRVPVGETVVKVLRQE